MASIMRPTMMRQVAAAAAAPTRRMMATNAPVSKTLLASQMARAVSRKETMPSAMRVAAFHSSARRDILPPPPQRLQGTANDAAPVPEPHPTHGSYHWTFERLVSVALIPVTIAPFAGGSLNPVLDATLCALLVAHSHVGFQSMIIDYLPNKRVPKTRTLFEWALRAGSLVVAVGLYEFETNDVGLTEAIKRIWRA